MQYLHEGFISINLKFNVLNGGRQTFSSVDECSTFKYYCCTMVVNSDCSIGGIIHLL